jgi:3-hydroxy acid dehydrogenase/malonic semialdehyde reductase
METSPENLRTALVTGASRGIGEATCRRLRARGFQVHGLARSEAALRVLAAEIGIVPLIADITDTAAIAGALSDVDIDVLVSNAGLISSVKPLHEQSAEEIGRMIDVNLRAPLQLASILLPKMIARGRGHIIHLTSTAAHHVFAGTVPYAAAKAGLAHASRVMRYDLVGTGVRVTEISPGRVETDIYLQAHGGDRDRLKEAMYADVRALTADDVAKTIEMAVTLPDHVDLTHIEISPTDQATGGHAYAAKRK